MRIEFNTTLLRQRMAGIRAQLPNAERLAVSAIASGIAQNAVALTRRYGKVDTGRYVRGWEIANNQLPEVPTLPLTPITESRRAGQNVKRNAANLRYFTEVRDKVQREVDEMATWSHTDFNEYYQAKKKTLAKLNKIVDRAQAFDAVLRSSEGSTAIFIGGKRGKNGVGLGYLGKVSTKFYGGSASMYQIGTRWYATIRNLEPHARLVEYGFRKKAKTESGVEVDVGAAGAYILGRSVAAYRSLGGITRGDAQRKFISEIRRGAKAADNLSKA